MRTYLIQSREDLASFFDAIESNDTPTLEAWEYACEPCEPYGSQWIDTLTMD